MALGRESLLQLEETELRSWESDLPPTFLSQGKVSRRNTALRLVSKLSYNSEKIEVKNDNTYI